MANTVAIQKQRDRKERDISSMEFTTKSSTQSAVMFKKNLDQMIQDYQKWKKENNIEGILY